MKTLNEHRHLRKYLYFFMSLAIAAIPINFAATSSLTAIGVAPPSTDWGGFVHDFVETDFRIDPAFAISEGRHDYDGKLPDWSDAGLQRRADFLRSTIAKAGSFTGLTPEQTFERDYLIAVAKGQLFWLTDADSPHTNPAFYLGGGLDPATYTSRPYADATTRLKAMIAYMKAVPTAISQARANLRTPMPRSFINYGVTAFGNLADYYVRDGKAAFASVKDPVRQAEYDAAAKPAAAAMKSFADWLTANRKTATETGYAMGAARFSRMLAATELVDVPLDRLEAVGRADLARNQAALKAACARYAPGATIKECMAKAAADKPVDGPVAEARRQVPMLHAFVVEHDLVTLPGTEQVLVAKAPPYNSQTAAYMDPPGPFDKGVPSIYYIAPPDPRWSKAQQAAYVLSKGNLLFITVHEVMPGHFVQFLQSNRSASEIGRLFVGYAYAEGWAHYCEQMMWDAGLSNGDPEMHIGQLSEALLRDVRFLSAIGLHARGMTEDESRRMFLDDAYQDEGNAEQQARRGTYDPAYLNYTLGKLMITKLREDWTATRGGHTAWKPFHDAFLAFGGPPIPLIRRVMLGDASPAL